MLPLPSLMKRSPLDVLQELVNSILIPVHKGKSESFSKWNGPNWRSVREGKSWLESRQTLEGAEGLWRIDDKIYDLNDFVEKHPGGGEWIKITKGTDITEMFKSHHISNAPRDILSTFYVREAKTTRNSPFTFEHNGFYEVLRRRISDQTRNFTRGPSLKSKALADLLFTLTIFMSVATTRTGNYFLALASGVLLSSTTICAHNFFHQRDNWRRYYFQLSGLSVKGWRVSHAMSHHMFPNSQHDLEVAMFEPWLQWLPKEKTLFWRYISWAYSPVVYVLIFPISSLVRWGITGHDGVPELLPLVVPAVMVLGSSLGAFLSAIYWWAVILLSASFMFGLVGLNAGHHHPELFHDGDIVKSSERMDWGVYQMLTVRDRVEMRDSILGLVSFGDHCLHHLFPTLDHAYLPLLYPALRRTCQDFGMDLGGCSIWEAIRAEMISQETEPVEIVTRSNFKFSFNAEDAAPYFLSSGYQDMAVAVITIAGPGRYGKSFIMNFFLRYANHCYSQGKDPAGWLKNEDEPLTGFSWEKETERSTTCLNMWPEFFVCTQENGNKICIIFLDTQTGDERNTAAAEYSSIFAICSMISSVMILNVGSTIQEAYLQQLEVFAEYGKMAIEAIGVKPYQTLLFLVRDWRMNFQYVYGFDGGKLYLQQFLDKNNENRRSVRELESPRENLPNAFEDIKCFLMPRLGEMPTYGVGKEFKGTLKSIDNLFINHLAVLVPDVLAPQKLSAKVVNGQQVSVKELFVHLGRWVHLFNGPTMPVPTSMFNATVEANNEAAKENALNWFKEEVSKARGKTHINDAKLKEKLQELEDQSLKKFDNYYKMGGPQHSEVHREALKNTVEILKQNYLEENADLAYPYKKIIKQYMKKLSKIGKALLFLVFILILNDFISFFEMYELTTVRGYRIPIAEFALALTVGVVLYMWMAYQS